MTRQLEYYIDYKLVLKLYFKANYLQLLFIE